jgi:cytoskeleton protein RodZ
MRVTDTIDTEAAAANAHPAPGTAGARLRAAREAAGLTVDAVAQQLKLAPRQVVALEEDDFQRLPGRTFVRGFTRNYARFLRLDADALLALLPATEGAASLERPSFSAARRPMGEIPVERAPARSPARLLVPLLLIAIVAAVGYYEYRGPHEDASRDAAPAARSDAVAASAPQPGTTAAAAQSGSTATAPAPSPAAPSSTPGTTMTTALPNPVASAPAQGGETREAAAAAPAAASAPSTASSSAAGTPSTASSTAVPDAAANASAAAAAAGAAGRESAAPPAGEAALVLAFKGTSWAEVRDAKGRVILQMTGGAGMTQTVSGMPPLELALGNAPEVVVTYRGQSLDLGPYTRGNVARVALR